MPKETKTKNQPKVETETPAPAGEETSTGSNTVLLAIIAVLLFFIVVIALAIGGWYWWQSRKVQLPPAESNIPPQVSTETPVPVATPTGNESSEVQGNLNANRSAVSAGSGTFESPSTATRPIVSPDFQMSGVYYWNCKHHYTLTYPAAWANNGATSSSNPLILKGNQVQLWVQAIPIASSETLKDFVKERAAKISGQLAWVEAIDWDGTTMTQVTYRGPDSLALWWLTTNYGMEIKAFGPGYENEYENIANTISTLDPNRNVYQCATNPNQTFGKPAAATQPVTTAATSKCTYPSGDPVDWWCMTNEAERDCYESQHGDPDDVSDKDCVKTTDEDDEECNYPKGPVADWWDDASKSAKNCYLDDGGTPPDEDEDD